MVHVGRLGLQTWTLSLALHALALLPLTGFASSGAPTTYDEGTGADAFRLEQGMTIEAVSFGDAAERVEIAEVAPMVAQPTPPPVIETKPVEPDLKAVITATQSPTETAAVVELPPPDVVKPQEVAERDQTAQVAILTEKSAGAAQDGGKAEALSAYVGKIHGALQRAKVSAASGGVGQVTLGFTLDAGGRVIDKEVIKSSGVASLDRAAVEWLERAAFPPLPGVLGSGQRFNVPLTFKRKSS
jgi:protein TonB